MTDMIVAAAQRAQVWVYAHNTMSKAILIAWNPRRPDGRRRNGYAVVQYQSGKRAAVRHHQVTLDTEENHET